MYYGNEAIMMDRAGDVDATVAAADKAIAADPNKPIPYYLKGKALITKATVDKAGKIVAPERMRRGLPEVPAARPQRSFLRRMQKRSSHNWGGQLARSPEPVCFFHSKDAHGERPFSFA